MQCLLQALHWLPDQARIDYKLSTVCHNFFADSSPAHFSDLTMDTPSMQLHSSADTWILPIAHVRTKTFGQRCFSYWSLLHSILSRLQHCIKNSPLQTVPLLISDSVFLLASPIYPPSPVITFLRCVCVRERESVCVCV